MNGHISSTAGAELASGPGPEGARPDGQLLLGCDLTAGEARVSFTGDLDMASADQAFCYVRDVIDRYHTCVILDATGVRFCDARGLAAFLRMSRYARQARTSLRLISPSRRMLQILRITGLADVLVTKAPASSAAE
jgi:anti-anti-sigma factor